MSPQTQYYQPLFQGDIDVEQLKLKGELRDEPVAPQPRPTLWQFTWKRLLFLLFFAFSLVQSTVLTVSYIVGHRANGDHHRRPHAHRLGTPCAGSHSNVSSAASLPTHFTLPSGDKIPSVALGASDHALGKVARLLTGAVPQASGRPGRMRSGKPSLPR